MMLGVLLHSADSYATIPLGGVWPYKDVQAARPVFDYILMGIHSFRMPLFFLLAGFFAHLLLNRRGIKGLIRNRLHRILTPFVVGWFVLYIPVWLGFQYGGAPHGSGRLVAAWSGVRLLNTTIHLWFLNYLLWFYTATVLAVGILRPFFAPLQETARRVTRLILGRPYRAILMAFPTTAVLWFMRSGSFESSNRLVPAGSSLVAYSMFYIFGWMLYNEAYLLEELPHFAGLQTVVGFLLVPVTFHALVNAGMPPIARNTPEQLIAIVTGALSVWLLIFGITGLFVKHLRQTNRVMNYLCDASYWIYLVHLPVVLWLSVLLEDWGVSGLVKYPVVVSVATVLLLGSYHFLVPGTIIGKFIDGTASQQSSASDTTRASRALGKHTV
jgi:fucose 4-O-acetylase-like acetyltransferase